MCSLYANVAEGLVRKKSWNVTFEKGGVEISVEIDNLTEQMSLVGREGRGNLVYAASGRRRVGGEEGKSVRGGGKKEGDYFLSQISTDCQRLIRSSLVQGIVGPLMLTNTFRVKKCWAEKTTFS